MVLSIRLICAGRRHELAVIAIGLSVQLVEHVRNCNGASASQFAHNNLEILTTHSGQVSRSDTTVMFLGLRIKGGAYQARTAISGVDEGSMFGLAKDTEIDM